MFYRLRARRRRRDLGGSTTCGRRGARWSGWALVLVGLLLAIGALGWPTARWPRSGPSSWSTQSPMDGCTSPAGPGCSTRPAGQRAAASPDGRDQRVQLQDRDHVRRLPADVDRSTLPATLSPVVASTPEGRRDRRPLRGRPVRRRDGDRRHRPADLRCRPALRGRSPHGRASAGICSAATIAAGRSVRFARVPGGDDPARGYITLAETQAAGRGGL